MKIGGDWIYSRDDLMQQGSDPQHGGYNDQGPQKDKIQDTQTKMDIGYMEHTLVITNGVLILHYGMRMTIRCP